MRLLCAMIVGMVIGTEREYTHRPAGMRTHILVALGACAVMITGQMIFVQYRAYGSNADPARLSAQVITGVGFLGAGTIVVTRHRQIRGLTTAAGLWSVAGVGLALGVGFYEAALAGTVIIFVVITLLQKLDILMHRRTKRADIYFEMKADVTLGQFLRSAKEAGLEISDLHRDQGSDASATRCYTVSIKTAQRTNHTAIIETIAGLPGVLYAEEI